MQNDIQNIGFGDIVSIEGQDRFWVVITVADDGQAQCVPEGDAQVMMRLPVAELHPIPHPDSRRLDWLEEHQAKLKLHPEQPACWCCGDLQAQGETARMAIDQAIILNKN